MPHPKDWDQFVEAMRSANSEGQLETWNAIQKRVAPWISVELLQEVLHKEEED